MEEELTALLVHVAGGRRYWGSAERGAVKPYVVLNRISGVADYHMQGASGLVASRVQADCYGATYTSARQAARDLKRAVSGRRSGPIQGVFVDGDRDLPAEDAGPVNQLFRVSIDLIIQHQET